MTRDAEWSALSAECDGLGQYEIGALRYLAHRANAGLGVYGLLNLPRDPRDWTEETDQEVADFMLYLAWGRMVRRAHLHDTEPAPAHSVTGDGSNVVVVEDSDLIPDAAPTLPSTAPEGLYREVG